MRMESALVLFLGSHNKKPDIIQKVNDNRILGKTHFISRLYLPFILRILGSFWGQVYA